MAYAGLADYYVVLGDTLAARKAAEKALQIDDTLSEPQVSIGLLKLIHDLDLMGAEEAFGRAVILNPNDANARFLHAHSLVLLARIEDGGPYEPIPGESREERFTLCTRGLTIELQNAARLWPQANHLPPMDNRVRAGQPFLHLNLLQRFPPHASYSKADVVLSRSSFWRFPFCVVGWQPRISGGGVLEKTRAPSLQN